MSIFLDAHRRHLRDADTLLGNSRLANADHLYGMAAECGLKRLMIAFGMTTDGMGTPIEKKDKTHIDAVWIVMTPTVPAMLKGCNMVCPRRIRSTLGLPASAMHPNKILIERVSSRTA